MGYVSSLYNYSELAGTMIWISAAGFYSQLSLSLNTLHKRRVTNLVVVHLPFLRRGIQIIDMQSLAEDRSRFTLRVGR